MQFRRKPDLVSHPRFFLFSLGRFPLHDDGGQNFATGNEFGDLKRQRIEGSVSECSDLIRPRHNETRRPIAFISEEGLWMKWFSAI